MSDVEKYVTDTVLVKAGDVFAADGNLYHAILAALGDVLPAHRRNILREAAARLDGERHMDAAAGRLRQWADEVTP